MGEICNYKSTNKGKVRLFWQPQQPLSIPDPQGRHARVITVPIVMVIIGGDQMAMRELLVVGGQVLVWETLEGHTQWPHYPSEQGVPSSQDGGINHLPSSRDTRAKEASIGPQRLPSATELSAHQDTFLFQLYTPVFISLAKCLHPQSELQW